MGVPPGETGTDRHYATELCRLAGQLAHAWGNERFGDVVPFEEVCLGVEQHNVGHTAWKQAPTLNPQTGLQL